MLPLELRSSGASRKDRNPFKKGFTPNFHIALTRLHIKRYHQTNLRLCLHNRTLANNAYLIVFLPTFFVVKKVG